MRLNVEMIVKKEGNSKSYSKNVLSDDYQFFFEGENYLEECNIFLIN